MRRAYELGVRHYDTADMYGDGHNEELLAKFLRSGGADVVVATKFAVRRAAKGAYERTIDNSPAYIQTACEASLMRLGRDVIDLYYVHRVDPAVPIEDTVGAMSRLVAEGKVRHLGLSEVSAATLRRAAAVHPIAALQTEYSLWTRDIEQEILPACRELSVALAAYSPLGRGFLSGKITSKDELAANDFRRMSPRFADENLSRNTSLLKTVQQIAAAQHSTPAQIALAWLLAQGNDIFPIPGTRRIKYLEENIAAASITLTPDEITRLDASMPPGSAFGERYPEAGRKGLNA